MSSLVETMRRTVQAQDLLRPGDRVLVAVSGGPDSLALLHALYQHQEALGAAFLGAAHLDHGLRGAESQADARFVAQWCDGHGITCVLGQADISAMRGKTTQEAARAARYAFLNNAARELGADKIATAHTQDDQVETILLNILRGTGLDGLRGIPYRRDRVVRPLRDVSRRQVLDYCSQHDLAPRTDPSNLDPSHYLRNRIRLELLPRLASDYQPGVRQVLLRLAQTAARDADFLHQEALHALESLTMASDSAAMVLDARRLRDLHPALLRHVLRAAFERTRGTTLGVTHEHLDPICDALAGNRRLPFGITTPSPHCAARVTERRLTLRLRLLPGGRQV